jgi:DNA-binding transcriptional MerR regulator
VSYTTAQAARLAGCSASQLRYWARTDLVSPSDDDGYTFRDLVTLRVVQSLLESGLSTTRVRIALVALREIGDDDLPSLRLVTDGKRVWACYDDGQIIDALRHGQLALFVAVDRVVDEVAIGTRAFETERAAFVDELLG